jgi:hypothetical protein
VGRHGEMSLPAGDGAEALTRQKVLDPGVLCVWVSCRYFEGGPPTFSTNQVPTRVNSPSDVEVEDRNSSMGSLSFGPIVLQSTFTANKASSLAAFIRDRMFLQVATVLLPGKKRKSR